MQALKSQTALRRGGIVYLRTDELTPNPVQPRKRFDDESLEELSGSIKSYGILNPLTVRLRCGKYELVAGERRLRAAKIAGLEEVPCILIDVNMEDASLIALVENLQRRDLDFIEEALGISQLIRMFGMSQEEAARRIGKSQSAVANKLRLLKLPSDVLESLRQNGLTERHGRALLRLPNPVAQRAALEYIVDNGLTVNGNVAGQGAHHADLDGVTGSSGRACSGCGSGRSGSAGRGAAAGGQDTGSSHDTGSGQKVAARDHLFHNTISSCWKFFV